MVFFVHVASDITCIASERPWSFRDHSAFHQPISRFLRLTTNIRTTTSSAFDISYKLPYGRRRQTIGCGRRDLVDADGLKISSRRPGDELFSRRPEGGCDRRFLLTRFGLPTNPKRNLEVVLSWSKSGRRRDVRVKTATASEKLRTTLTFGRSSADKNLLRWTKDHG